MLGIYGRARTKNFTTLSTGYQNPISIIISVVCFSRWCVAIYVCTWATVKTIYSLIKLYTIQVSSVVAREGGQGERSPQNLKICKRWGTARASASSKPREQRKIQIFVNFLKILLKFSKTFKFFLKNFKFANKISKFLQSFTIFSQNTLTFLIYCKCLTFPQKKQFKINKIFSIILKIFLYFY